MYFKYTALNPESKKLIGTIEAVSENEARNKLNAFGFSVIGLQIYTPTESETAAGIKRFAFEGRDEKGRKVVGTIEAFAFEEAFWKLRDEYQIELLQLFPEGVPLTVKQASGERLQKMNAEYKEKKGAKKTAEQESETLKEGAFQKERAVLLQTVDQTIQMIQQFLIEYDKDMKVEERETVQNYINQLLRIKDSTNLAHIRRTCELMLDYIQKREIFLTERRRIKEQTKLRAETHEFLEELKKTGLKKEIKIIPFLKRLTELPVLRPIGKFLLSYAVIDDPEMAKTVEEIRNIRHRSWEFVKMYIREKDPSYRQEIIENISQLRSQKKRLRRELSALKLKRKTERTKQAEIKNLQTWASFSLLIGWLLAFYLLLYFMTFPLAFKKLPFENLPKSFFFYKSPFLQTILSFLFLLHASLGVKKNFFSLRFAANFIIYPASLLMFLLFIFNFVY